MTYSWNPTDIGNHSAVAFSNRRYKGVVPTGDYYKRKHKAFHIEVAIKRLAKDQPNMTKADIARAAGLYLTPSVYRSIRYLKSIDVLKAGEGSTYYLNPEA